MPLRWITTLLILCETLAGESRLNEGLSDGETVNDLKLVQLVFRHGDRAPFRVYKTDPYGKAIWTNGMGQLTRVGVKQHYDLGSFFRRRYHGFLNATNQASEVYIRSSDQDRTLESAAAFAAGLIPADASTSWSKDELGQTWRPVPVHSVAWAEESLLYKEAPCMEFKRLINESSNLPEARRLHKENRAVFDFVIKASGADPSTMKTAMDEWEQLDFVYDVLTCQQAHELNLPPWLNGTVFLKMRELSNVFFHMKYGANGDRARARLGGGNLLDLIVDRMRDKGHAKAQEYLNKTKLFVYSGHDTTVAGLLASLQLYNYSANISNIGIPHYASVVIIEQFQNDSVRVSFKNDPLNIPTSEPKIVIPPGCPTTSSLCPLITLVEVTKPFRVEDVKKECRGPQFGDNINVEDVSIALITVVLVIVLTTVALGCYKRKKSRRKASADSGIENRSLIRPYARLEDQEENEAAL
ncbi:hypothetical protein RvY_17961 [Ramazzottius varieornatus]|uniref:acid phosphatase n=1 Tax=Ramazzottius varieornatus TaxID=947166 RepID=A0A1D1W430_RAMVA|nr:hypothetical protein RvY_17961 [Ramazzottius varieornatus]